MPPFCFSGGSPAFVSERAQDRGQHGSRFPLDFRGPTSSNLKRTNAQPREGRGDLEPAQRGPKDGLVAVDHGLVETALDVLDRVDHAGGGAAQEVAVGLGPRVLDGQVRPLLRGDPQVLVAASGQPEPEIVNDLVAGLAQELDLVLVGGLHVGADEDQLLEPELGERFLDGEARGQGAAAAGLFHQVEDAGLAVLALGHRVGGAVKDDHARVGVRERLRGLDDIASQFAQRPRIFAGHTQARGVNADPSRRVALELGFGGGVAGGDDEADPLGGHRRAPSGSFSTRARRRG